MTNSQRLASVRSALRKWISDRQDDDSDVNEPASEAMLIRDGFFCGRRFRFKNFHAVWFLEEDELKIRDHAGMVLATLAGTEIDALAQAWEATPVPEVQTLSIVAHREQKSNAAATVSETGADPSLTEQVEHRRAA